MITEFNRQNLKTLRADIDEALAAVAEKHGIKLNAGNISFEPLSCKITCTAEVRETSDGMSPEQKRFEEYAPMFGLSADDYGKWVVFSGDRWKISGIEPKRRKYPIIVENARGTRKLTTVDGVKRLLNIMAGSK